MRNAKVPSVGRTLLTLLAMSGMAFLPSPAIVSAAPNAFEAPSRQTMAQAAPRQSSEERLWKIAVDSDKAGAYDAYLRKYPHGRYAGLAKSRLAILEAAAEKKANPAGRPQSSGDGSPGTSSTSVRQGYGLSAEDELWNAATATGQASDYQAYLREYPQGRYAPIAKRQLATAGGHVKEPDSNAGMAASESPRPSSAEESVSSGITWSGPERTIRFGDQTMTGNFSTDPATGKVSGTGRIVWSNGNRFEGTLNRGVKEGKGQFVWSNGQRYSGDWANDQPNGRGTIIFPNGDRYEGDVTDGQAHGQGIAKFGGGDAYAGNWVRGKRHGTGRYSWAGGGYWEGEFKDGERTENGVLTRGQPAPVRAPQSALGNDTRHEPQSTGK